MLTIFTIPKPFKNGLNIAQRNAIQSWLLAMPESEVILFGNDSGVAEVADEFGIINIPEVKKNEYGIPLLSWVFDTAKKKAKNDILVYINCDIILTQDFARAISRLRKDNFSLFLMSGRRRDLDLNEQIDFLGQDCFKKLAADANKRGKMHGFSGMDYFVFPKDFSVSLPDFAVGVSGWDTWLVYQTKRLKIPFIDATLLVMAIHQNHLSRNKKRPSYEKEKEKNFKLAGGQINMMTLREADWILTEKGLEQPPFPRIIFSKLALFYPWRMLFLIKRKLDQVIGRSI